MKLEKIEALIHMREASSLTAIEVQNGMDRVRLERSAMLPEMPAGPGPRPLPPPAVPAASAVPQDEPPVSSKPAAKGTEVKSPMVGVFYSSPSPDSEPYVTVGSRVKKGDVLCIIEAMKMMSEITAQYDGVVAEILAENGQAVGFGAPLLRLRRA